MPGRSTSERRNPRTILALRHTREIADDGRRKLVFASAAGTALADGDHGARHALHRRDDGFYPVVLFGSFHLPGILPPNDQVYAVLRTAHTLLAYIFFATILLHIAAALFHALIRRDGVFQAMTGRSVGRRSSSPHSITTSDLH
jgi:hypothetical protein